MSDPSLSTVPNPTGPDLTVVVLSGGASTRMGRDKATIPLGERTMLEHTIAHLPAQIPVLISGPEVSVRRSGVQFVQEDPPGGGPVAGLDAALPHVRTALLAVLAADLPFARDVAVSMADELRPDPDDSDDRAQWRRTRDAVMLVDAFEKRQMLCAVYRTASLRRAIAALDDVHGASMRTVVEGMNIIEVASSQFVTVSVSVDDDQGLPAVAPSVMTPDPAWDIDTPEQLAAAMAAMFGPTSPSQEERTMNEWVRALAQALELPDDVDLKTVLDLARDVAHSVERPAAPITTYLVGVAIGGGMSQADAVQRTRSLAESWSTTDSEGST